MDFAKLEGSGNDFILIDNRDGKVDKFLSKISIAVEDFVRKLCQPHKGIFADGVILIESPLDPSNDFRWRFFNSDGSSAEMCGNGARCAVRFCYDLGLVEKNVSFETDVGVVKAEILEGGRRVKVQLTTPSEVEEKTIELEDVKLTGYFVNTGVPHFVVVTENLSNIDVVRLGRKIRFHSEFKPKGTNVNFITTVDKRTLTLRTYERGVETETLACGTGATAAALVAHTLKLIELKPVNVLTRSGEILRVDFSDDIKEIFLEGPVRKIYEGFLFSEIFK